MGALFFGHWLLPRRPGVCSAVDARCPNKRVRGVADEPPKRSSAMLSVNKVTSVEEAVAWVRPHDTIATSGFVGTGTPDALIDGVARAFETSGTPRELTLVFAA